MATAGLPVAVPFTVVNLTEPSAVPPATLVLIVTEIVPAASLTV